ncbi:zinc finger C2HC domain-containing protein 1C [Scaptodrosophila lebanonensis]|uniref:Zinc finger C2HC domain-containing protein 1C n=1 Tax=Drosophila lebanonensis TaxID=7225 RepID=A0A6J2T208_DROLE|nr:zinc finger C2HC domain-containing protein 1C [Scaptodrosophila lebanonensis]XP_030370946.1 zinc finger C2HC domain-containing protein 1C [Scaptodrosophila lebanonensis]
MASQGVGESQSSKLGQLRMRFQQKTQQEQEQRRRELNTSLANGNDSIMSVEVPPGAKPNRLTGNGKVRQMFDERRRGVGIDRSHPLKPIGTTGTTSNATERPARTLGGGTTTSRFGGARATQQLTKGMSTMSLKEGPVTGRRITNDSNNNTNNSKYNATGTVNSNRLRPVLPKKTPPGTAGYGARSISTPPISAKLAPRLAGGQQQKQPISQRVPARNANVKSPVTKNTMSRQTVNSPGPTQSNTAGPEGTSKCRFCGRSFHSERLQKHEAVCQRTMFTKRKIFDASKQRVKGTESEKYVKRPMHRAQSQYSSAAQQMSLSTGVKKNNWRKKHEEFIQSIRAAKQVQAHLARGGKLSDLPPPPPSENPDYIQCPHCGRRFNQQAAERHIPRCATMIHNKPRRDGPPPLKKR